MAIWTPEIKELEKLYESLKGQLPELEKELERLVKADDENMILLYSRRCLEVIITDLCECELKRDRGTEPLKGIIDKLNKDKKVPSHIITSMDHLNSLSAYGAHPKDFDPEQLKPVLVNLDIIIKWYLKHQGIDTKVKEEKIQFRGESLVEINKETIISGKEKPDGSPKQKLLSGVLISAILVIAGILAYPKIFKGRANLQAMTMTVSVLNENGERVNRNVFKNEYITKLSIFPFSNETNDPSKSWLQIGISDAICLDLTQFNYISYAFDRNTTHLQEQIKYAKNNNHPYFLTGVFRVTNGIYEITSRLYQTTNGTVKAERVFKGNDFFSLIDSISLQTRIDMNISKPILNSFPDLPVNEQSTNNLDAYHYYTRRDSFYFNKNKAIQLDSTFALALYYHAAGNYNIQSSYESAQKFILQAMRHRQGLSENHKIPIQILYYLIFGENDKAIALAEMQHELQPNNIQLLLRLIDTYDRNFMIQKLERSLEQLNELLPDMPTYQIQLARSYLFTGKLDKGLEVLKQTLKDNPENTGALLQMGEIYLHKNDLEAAEEVYQKAILLSPEDKKYWSLIFDHIAYVRNNSLNNNFLKAFTGNYKFEKGELSLISFIHNNYLVIKGVNQIPLFIYPVFNNQFITYAGWHSITLESNNQGKVTKFFIKQRIIPNSLIVWKEDSLILHARNLLISGKKTEALSAFRRAYDQNPEHYYLSNFIQHLEFIQGQEYEKLGPVFDSYSGEYGGLKLYKDKGQIYYKNTNGEIYLLLPLSKSKFFNPSIYDAQIQIVKENDSIKGLKFFYQDGKEEFFSRKN